MLLLYKFPLRTYFPLIRQESTPLSCLYAHLLTQDHLMRHQFIDSLAYLDVNLLTFVSGIYFFFNLGTVCCEEPVMPRDCGVKLRGVHCFTLNADRWSFISSP